MARKKKRRVRRHPEPIEATPEEVAEVVLRVEPRGWRNRPTADLIDEEQENDATGRETGTAGANTEVAG